MRIAAALAAGVVSSLVGLVLPAAAQSAVPTPSWRCIAGICVWESRAHVDYDHGTRPPDLPSREIAVPGGRVWTCYWRCTNAVTEDGFTYYGGTQRPANVVLTVSTCSRIFRLPDGATFGTRTPDRGRWNGYRHRLFEGGVTGWDKTVRSGRTIVDVSLQLNAGRVNCVSLEVVKLLPR